jgi:hypothetical protein
MPCPSCLGDAGPDRLSLRAEERGTFDSRLGKEHETCGQFKRLRAAMEDTQVRAGDLPGRTTSTTIKSRVLSEGKVVGRKSKCQTTWPHMNSPIPLDQPIRYIAQHFDSAVIPTTRYLNGRIVDAYPIRYQSTC